MTNSSGHIVHWLLMGSVAALVASAIILATLEPSAANSAVSAPSDEATRWIEIIQARQRGDDVTVLRLLRPLADAGVARAQYELGEKYFLCCNSAVPQNATEAVKWFRLAAAQGLAAAQYAISLAYSEGRGVPKDDTEATKWLRLATTHGGTAASSAPISLLSVPRQARTDEYGAGFYPSVAARNKVIDLTTLSLNIRDVKAKRNEFEKEAKAAIAQNRSFIDPFTPILVEATTIDDMGDDVALVVQKNGQHGVIAAYKLNWSSSAQVTPPAGTSSAPSPTGLAEAGAAPAQSENSVDLSRPMYAIQYAVVCPMAVFAQFNADMQSIVQALILGLNDSAKAVGCITLHSDIPVDKASPPPIASVPVVIVHFVGHPSSEEWIIMRAALRNDP